MKLLEDTDPMPFGKYGPKPKGEGFVMSDVPAAYFHYLWEAGLKNEVKSNPVAEYINRNLEALKSEDEDKIWSRPR